MHSDPDFISIVIPNYNGKHFLHDCLCSLRSQTYEKFETIVVDNGSSDGSVAYIRENFPGVRIVQNTNNRGFAGGTNDGIRVAEGSFILTLNNDTKSDPHFIEELVKHMADPSVGMCASKMLSYDGTLIDSTGICISRSGAAWDRGRGSPAECYSVEEEMFGPCAGAALYRRSMLDEIGLFDEDFFLVFEDVDLAYRARLTGWKCIYTPKAIVYHVHGGSVNVGSDTAVYYGNRNTFWVVVKNYPVSLLLEYSPWIIGRNTGIIFHYAIRGQLTVILKSKVDALLGALSIIRKRKLRSQQEAKKIIERFQHTWCEVRKQNAGDSHKTHQHIH